MLSWHFLEAVCRSSLFTEQPILNYREYIKNWKYGKSCHGLKMPEPRSWMVGSAYPLLRVSDHLDLPPQEREQERRPSSGGRGEKVWKMSHGGWGCAPSEVQVGVLPVVVVPLVLLASIKRHLLLPFDPLLGTLEPLWAGSALVNPVTPQLRSYITKILLLTYLDIGTFREGSKVVWKK